MFLKEGREKTGGLILIAGRIVKKLITIARGKRIAQTLEKNIHKKTSTTDKAETTAMLQAAIDFHPQDSLFPQPGQLLLFEFAL